MRGLIIGGTHGCPQEVHNFWPPTVWWVRLGNMQLGQQKFQWKWVLQKEVTLGKPENVKKLNIYLNWVFFYLFNFFSWDIFDLLQKQYLTDLFIFSA